MRNEDTVSPFTRPNDDGDLIPLYRLSWRTPPRDFWDSTSGRKGDTVPIETKVETCKAKSDSNSSKRRKNGKKADIAKADEAKVGAKTKDDLKAKVSDYRVL